MLTIGLTGSIGMGKSTTAGLFREAGIAVHDSDACVHELYRGAAAPLIEHAFPGSTRNGEVDRTLLAPMVLGKQDALKKLEAIIHPLVATSRHAFTEQHRKAGSKAVVFDIPLLFETGSADTVDLILVVSAGADIQRQRVLARPGMTEEKFQAILARQVPDTEKRQRAHWLIDTSCSVEHARQQTGQFLRAIKAV